MFINTISIIKKSIDKYNFLMAKYSMFIHCNYLDYLFYWHLKHKKIVKILLST